MGAGGFEQAWLLSVQIFSRKKHRNHAIFLSFTVLRKALLTRIEPKKWVAKWVVRKSGIDVEDLSKIVYDDNTYTQAVYLLQNSKFISEYQGRLYESPTDGIFKAGTMQINEDMLKEYFSEGYRAFYQEPSALKEKDPQLYHFIEGLKNDQK